ncbi:hypothetical protein [Vibrio phage vB_VpS_BA3]|nr:hypothetical protein [Vibrio phage vB_VpS_BA3]
MPKLSSNAKVAAHATMQVLKTTEQNNGLLAPGLEGLSNGYLAGFTERVMKETLKAAVIEKGRTGWWSDNICTIDDLMNMRAKALADNDHASVINFTAMIMYREAAGECLPLKKIQYIHDPKFVGCDIVGDTEKYGHNTRLSPIKAMRVVRGQLILETEVGECYTPRYSIKEFRVQHEMLLDGIKANFGLELN